MTTNNIFETILYELLKIAGDKFNEVIPDWVTALSLLLFLLFLIIILWANKERNKKVSQRDQTKR